MKNCCLFQKCQHSSLQKINEKAILFLFYKCCEKLRSYIGLYKFPAEKLVCVFLFEKKTVEFVLCYQSCNRCANKNTNSNMIIMKRIFIVSVTVIKFHVDIFVMISTCHTKMLNHYIFYQTH